MADPQPSDTAQQFLHSFDWQLDLSDAIEDCCVHSNMHLFIYNLE